MSLLGTIVNVAAIVVGTIIGLLVSKVTQGIRTSVMQGLGIAVILLGITMGMKSNQFIIVIGSIVLGGIVGDLLDIDRRLTNAGNWIESKIDKNKKGGISTAFVTTTLLFCVGPMAILGSLDSGLRNNHDILYTKAMLDGFSSIFFTSTLGIGVIFSVIPVLLYQGIITLGSTFITSMISDELLNRIINEVTSVGGILVIGIGLNILEIRKINVANLLPALLVAAIITYMV